MCWVEAMVNPHVQAETRIRLFSAAIQKHIRNMEEGMQLKGCDLHLLALSSCAQEEGWPTPAIFTDPSYTKSGGGYSFVLGGSLLGYSQIIGGCAPSEQGYGAYYNIEDQTLTFLLTSWARDQETDVKQLFSYINLSLDDMRSLLETAAAPTVSRL